MFFLFSVGWVVVLDVSCRRYLERSRGFRGGRVVVWGKFFWFFGGFVIFRVKILEFLGSIWGRMRLKGRVSIYFVI